MQSRLAVIPAVGPWAKSYSACAVQHIDSQAYQTAFASPLPNRLAVARNAFYRK